MCRTPFDERAGQPELDSVNMITEALIEKFGHQAAHFADRQLATASPESRETWASVVSRLSQQ